MKTLIFSIAIVLMSFKFAPSQTVMCSNLCVTDVQFQDTGVLTITIQFNGTGSEFINYPYVSSVLDAGGNVIATGSMFYFGQIVNTSQDYEATTSLTPPFPENFDGTIVFNYDTVFCLLPFSCLTQVQENFAVEKTPLRLLSNPVADKLIMVNYNNTSATEFIIYESSGRQAKAGKIKSGQNEINVGDLKNGIYFLTLPDSDFLTVKFLKI